MKKLFILILISLSFAVSAQWQQNNKPREFEAIRATDSAKFDFAAGTDTVIMIVLPTGNVDTISKSRLAAGGVSSATLNDTATAIRADIPTNNNQLTNGAGFQTAGDVTTAILGKLNESDTAAMLAPYATTQELNDSASALRADIVAGSGITASDTAAMLKAYTRGFVDVTKHGCLCDGVTDDYDSLQAVFNNYNNKTILLPANATCIVSHELILNGVELLHVVGQNSTIKRIHGDSVSTTLSQIATIGNNYMVVADPSRFRTTKRYIILDGSEPGAGKISGEYSIVQVQSISNDTVFFNANLTAPTSNTGLSIFPIGSVVIPQHNMFYTDDTPSRWEGITFDGNRQNGNNKVKGWEVMGTMRLYANTTIQYCHFKNTPSENIFIKSGCNVLYNTFESLDGSFVHISGTVTPHKRMTIAYNKGDGVCQATQDTTNHSEAAITFSTNAFALDVFENEFKNGSEAFIGPVGVSASCKDLQIYQNEMETFKYVMEITDISGTSVKDILFTQNRVIDSRYIGIRTNRNVDRNFIITNNIFENFSFKVATSRGISFNNNKIYNYSGYIPPYNDSDYYQLTYAHFGQNQRKGLIQLYYSQNIEIVGNTIVNEAGSYNDNAPVAINISELALKYHKINYNIIKNYKAGIATGIPSQLNSATQVFSAVEVIGNYIQLEDATSTEFPTWYRSVGIQTRPGMLVDGNDVFLDTTFYAGIMVPGTAIGGGADDETQPMTRVENNYIHNVGTSGNDFLLDVNTNKGLVLRHNIYEGTALGTSGLSDYNSQNKRFIYHNLRRTDSLNNRTFQNGSSSISLGANGTISYIGTISGLYTRTQIDSVIADTLAIYTLNPTIIDVATSRNLAAADVSNIVRGTDTLTLTIPLTFTGMAVGKTIAILNATTVATVVTITGAGGVTLNGSSGGSATLTGPHSSGVLVKTGTNTYEFY